MNWPVVVSAVGHPRMRRAADGRASVPEASYNESDGRRASAVQDLYFQFFCGQVYVQPTCIRPDQSGAILAVLGKVGVEALLATTIAVMCR